MNHNAINGNDVLIYFTARQRICGKVIFSVVCVCVRVCLFTAGVPCDAIDQSQITWEPPKHMLKLVQLGTLLDHRDPPPTSVGKTGGRHSTEKSSYLLILSCEVCKFRLLSDDLLLLLIIIQFFTIF